MVDNPFAVKSLPLINQGKVRDIYRIDKDTLLIVASDRLSAFDVILPDPIPDKGKILTSISNFWFKKTNQIIQNHLIEDFDLSRYLTEDEIKIIDDRYVVVKRLNPLPFESVIRGYIIGSGWKDYLSSHSISGIKLPTGLKLAEKFAQPIFTPATKAKVGEHDENISSENVAALVGKELSTKVEDISHKLYEFAFNFALDKGIILADTKFEFGLDDSGELFLIDEIFTPDSSRYWPLETYEIGKSPESMDKQFVRDYLETLDWDKKSPGPKLPLEIINKSSNKYQQIKNILCN